MHDLAARARAGEFNDYFGEHALPQHMLIALVRTDSRATTEQRQAFIDNVISGKYDGTQAEAEEWMRSDEGGQSLAELMGTVIRPTNPHE